MNDNPASVDVHAPGVSKPSVMPPKQAVIIIHGMGEQRPMDTLREFVKAVWQSDADIKEEPDAAGDGELGDIAEINRRFEVELRPTPFVGSRKGESEHVDFKPKRAWMTPETLTDAPDLHRFATSPTARGTISGSDQGYRVDFYELYWADIMAGSRGNHLRAWLSAILLRWPYRVPHSVYRVWWLLWFLAVFFLVTFLFCLVWFFSHIHGAAGIQMPALSAIWADSATGGALSWISYVFAGLNWGFTFLLAATLIFLFLRWCYLAWRGIGSAPVRRSSPKPDIRVAHSWWAAIAVGMVLLVGIALVVATATLFLAVLALAAGLLALFYIKAIPVFGDVARYVQATPENVLQRAQILKRGVELLKRLHEMRAGTEATDPDAPVYGRIILVGHSLGSVIAYDLLSRFWAQAGPLHRPLSGESLRAWKAMHAFLYAHASHERDDTGNSDPHGGKHRLELDRFHNLQLDIQRAMRADGIDWRVTDMVTLGSPLSLADFLVAQGSDRFRDLILNRFIAMSPPFPYEGGREGVLYNRKSDDGQEKTLVHHAAVFGAVRWSNVFDPGRFPFQGDMFSGSCKELFGEGIDEYELRLQRPPIDPSGGLAKLAQNSGLEWLRLALLQIVTHSHYWNIHGSGEVVRRNGDFQEHTEEKPRLTHVGALREAIGLDRYGSYF